MLYHLKRTTLLTSKNDFRAFQGGARKKFAEHTLKKSANALPDTHPPYFLTFDRKNLYIFDHPPLMFQ